MLGLFVTALFIAMPAAVHAQSRDVTNRLNRLENEIQTLNRAVYKGENPPASMSAGDPSVNAGFEVRIQQLEMELRDMRGKMEEHNYKIRQLTEKIDRAIGDLELRIQDLGQPNSNSGSFDNAQPRYVVGQSKFVTPKSQVAQPQNLNNAQSDSFTWSSNPKESNVARPATGSSNADLAAAAYENAFSLLKNSNYEAAGKGFEAFIQKNPGHPLIGNAQYWLGETHYVRGDYANAARVFAEGYQKFPQGTKAADNLLKLGMSLAATGNKNDACIAFSQLKKDFSGGSGPVLRRADQEMSKAGCS